MFQKKNLCLAQIRLRIFRGIRSIMNKDEESFVNSTSLKNKLTEYAEIEKPDEKPKPNFTSQLRSWALNFNIQRNAVTALLKILIMDIYASSTYPRIVGHFSKLHALLTLNRWPVDNIGITELKTA